ncbi:family 2 encapsulin nanocompartment cargo protein polyprenyl transferase [Lentzea sp. NPDC051213]|uniref:family 2 encapsulin nanocompartment cargo protein polyprenyl transferase n=1 Tax=Lentzea sp. NPDC051213 TaxID=3364126 RepID=UPI003793824C
MTAQIAAQHVVQTGTTTRSAKEILAWSRRITDSELRAGVAQLPRSMRRIAGYHFGWWDADGEPTPGTDPGKAVRPALVLLAAQAVGGAAEVAVPAAVAVELVHNFSLLHDDVMDNDPVRRHRPTAWTVFGVADAVLAGDALQALASQMLAPNGALAVEVLNRCVIELCQGQSSDVEFEQRAEVGLEECCEMVAGKTGSLLGCACMLGAIVAGADSERTRLFGSFGRHIGLAFQLIDDLLGIWGDPAVTGKPVHSDLANRKKSLPVVAALATKSAAARELAELYRQPGRLDEAQLERAAALVDQTGAREWARTRADQEIDLAMADLGAAGCDPRADAELRELAMLITSRDR